MRKWILWIAGASLLCAVAVVVGATVLSNSACRAATKDGTLRDFRNFTEKELERNVRDWIPLGSSRGFVENFLAKEKMTFSYDSSINSTLASAPCLKGSGIVVTSLGFTFRFDNDSKLVSIESRVHLMGP